MKSGLVGGSVDEGGVRFRSFPGGCRGFLQLRAADFLRRGARDACWRRNGNGGPGKEKPRGVYLIETEETAGRGRGIARYAISSECVVDNAMSDWQSLRKSPQAAARSIGLRRAESKDLRPLFFMAPYRCLHRGVGLQNRTPKLLCSPCTMSRGAFRESARLPVEKYSKIKQTARKTGGLLFSFRTQGRKTSGRRVRQMPGHRAPGPWRSRAGGRADTSPGTSGGRLAGGSHRFEGEIHRFVELPVERGGQGEAFHRLLQQGGCVQRLFAQGHLQTEVFQTEVFGIGGVGRKADR